MATESDADRVNGWKEIATYLGVHERTAHRREEEEGLPVRRLGKTVFAYKSEIDSWLRAHPPTALGQPEPPAPLQESPGRTRKRALAATACTLVLAVPLVWSIPWSTTADWQFRLPRVNSPPTPIAWRVENNVFHALDSQSRNLWSYPFGFQVDNQAYGTMAPGPALHPVLLADLDGDGRNEAILRSRGTDGHDDVLHVVSADGELLFKQRVDRDVVYPGKRASPPFGVNAMIVDKEGGAPRIVVSRIHHQFFHSAVQVLSPKNEVLSEFWNDGHIVVVAAGELGTDHVIAAGGINNETESAFLAILDPATRHAVAPSESPTYACSSCEGGPPRGYLLFPRSSLAKRLGSKPFVLEIRPEPRGHMRVAVTQFAGQLPGDTVTTNEVVFYEVDERLDIVKVMLDSDYNVAHARAVALGFETEEQAAANRHLMKSARVWDGGRFAPAKILDDRTLTNAGR